MRVVLVAVLLGGVATAAATPKPGLPPVWIGVFDPKLPAHAPWDNPKLTPVAHGGAVRVLTPSDGPAASGEVVVVHPILARTAAGKVDKGAVELADFAFDQRDGDDGVLVLPAGTQVSFAAPTKVDASAIEATLLRTGALASVRRAVAGIELAGIDVDGDGRADFAMTYGCSAWFDGACQSKGQFVLARTGSRWTIIE
ncbi:MAG TPA: hypothetical protein VH165_07415 [Kofleriaceae bacterium]|nr:hypothetical protein [Kofleriaceae bacterium]